MKNHAPGGKGGLEAAATECLEHLLPGQKDGGIVGLSQEGARRVHKVHEDYKRVDGCPYLDLSRDFSESPLCCCCRQREELEEASQRSNVRQQRS